MSAQHSVVVSCTSHHIKTLSCCQKYTDKQGRLSRPSLSWCMQCLAAWGTNQWLRSMCHILLCGALKTKQQLSQGALGSHYTTHSLTCKLCLNNGNSFGNYSLVGNPLAKMWICLGRLGNEVLGVNCRLTVSWPLGTLGWICTCAKGTLWIFRHQWRNSGKWRGVLKKAYSCLTTTWPICLGTGRDRPSRTQGIRAAWAGRALRAHSGPADWHIQSRSRAQTQSVGEKIPSQHHLLNWNSFWNC